MLKHVITLDGEPLNASVDIPSNRDLQLHTFEQFEECSPDLDVSITSNVSPDDPAIIMFTSVFTWHKHTVQEFHFSCLVCTR